MESQEGHAHRLAKRSQNLKRKEVKKMLLILEIALTIWAWRRGWKTWSLVPLGAAIGIAFLLGFAGVALDEASLMWLLPDLAAIISLIVMVSKGRQVQAKPATAPETTV